MSVKSYKFNGCLVYEKYALCVDIASHNKSQNIKKWEEEEELITWN